MLVFLISLCLNKLINLFYFHWESDGWKSSNENLKLIKKTWALKKPKKIRTNIHIVSEDLLSTFCQLFHLSLCILNGQWKKQFSTVADWNNVDCVITQTHDELFKLSAEILVFIKASKLGRVFLWKHSTEYLGQRARYEFLKIWSVKSSLHTRPSLSNIRQCLSNTWPSVSRP